MRVVAVIGIGQISVGEHWNKSLRDLASDAVVEALQDAGLNSVDSLFIGNMMSGSANHQYQLGALIGDWSGQRFSEAVHIEAACSSGSAAFRSAVLAVASGQVETAVAVGVEKMTDSPGNEITLELATAADSDWEVDHGISFVALNALIMRRYMHEHKLKKEHFAPFSINAHANAVHNPNARLRKPITEDTYHKAVMIADPINIMDASPVGDGAAAAVLIPMEKLHLKEDLPIVRVIGSTASTDTISIHDRRDPTWLTAAEKSAKQAYSQAGIGPEDVDFFEAHDAFSIMAALSLEASGFAERGRGVQLALDGEITPTGQIPIATRGGLKARGHPVGATGMYQIVEVVQQLRQQAGNNQIENARIGMSQNIGGSGSNIITHLFSNSSN